MSEQARDIELERMEAAARWLVCLRESPDDEHLIAEWLTWCDADDANLETFQRIQDTWRTAGEVRTAESKPAAVPPRVIRRWWTGTSAFARAAAVAVLLLGGAAVWMVMQPGGDTLSTAVAMHASSSLPDGSHLDLGALSRVHIQYSERERRLKLDSGEAFFEVAHDPARPFVVDAGKLTVTAVGTAFNVHRTGDRVVVTVSKGRVRLQSDSGRIWDITPSRDEVVEASAGQQATYSDKQEHIVTAAVADPDDAAAWRHGVLKFVHEPLNVVISDLNRYSHRKIELGDPDLNRLRYTGTVFSNSLDDWLKAVQNVFPVRVERVDDNHVILEPIG